MPGMVLRRTERNGKIRLLLTATHHTMVQLVVMVWQARRLVRVVLVVLVRVL